MNLVETRRQLELRRTLRRTKGLIPGDGSLAGLIAGVAEHTGRNLVHVEVELAGSSVSGAWIPTPNADYLLSPAGAPATRAAVVVCHEIAHIMLGHEPAFHLGGTLEKVQAAMTQVSPSTVQRMLARAGYTDRQERDAEYFATVLNTTLAHRRVAAEWRAASLISERLR